MESDSVTASLLMDGTGTTYNPFLDIPDNMGLFDFEPDLFMNSDLPDFITTQEAAVLQEFSPESSPVPSPPTMASLNVPDLIKNEPLSPGQVSDGGSSSDEACYIELSRISPVKTEAGSTFVNPASLDVKFCNEQLSPLSSMAAAQRVAPRRALKRRRETTIKPTISPDQLFPGSMETHKQLSPEEERELKKQKRLIKNRESAQKSRQRRKAYIEELETKVQFLTGQTEQLAQENKVLKEDLAYLLNVLKKTPGVPSEVLSKTASLGMPTAPAPIRGVKAAGVCLLIVLFSFGLFFNAKNGPSGPALPFDPNTPREPIPEVLPTTHYDKKYNSRLLKSLKDAEFDERRELLEIFPERSRGRRLIQIKEEKVPQVEQLPPVNEVPTHHSSSTLDTVIKKEKTDEALSRETPCIKKQKKSGNWTKTPVVMDTVEEEGVLVTRNQSDAPRSTTSYFFCSDAREVMMEDSSDQSQQQQPRTVSLLVPLEAFNGTAAGEGPLAAHLQNHVAGAPAFVEVSCQVLNMNVFTTPSNNTVSVL